MELMCYPTGTSYNVYVRNNEYLNKMVYISDDQMYFSDEKIKVIEENAFKNVDSLRTIHLPPNIQEIESHAFENCSSIKSIFLKNSENDFTIQRDAFKNCTKLDSVIIETSKNVTIEGDAFKNCFYLRVLIVSCNSLKLSSNIAKESSNLVAYISNKAFEEEKSIATKFREWNIKLHTIGVN